MMIHSGLALGGEPREQKMIKGHLPRVITKYTSIRRRKTEVILVNVDRDDLSIRRVFGDIQLLIGDHSRHVLGVCPSPETLSRSPEYVFQEASARYRAEEPSSGSSIIPRRVRPGLAGLRPHR